MVNKLINFFILILFTKSILSMNICNLKLAKDKLSSIRGGDIIYDRGIINKRWEDTNNHSLQLTDYFHDLDYFYATEIHENNSIAHDKLSITISSNNISISNPKVEIKPEGFTTNMEITTVEVLYNCKEGVKGVAEIKMTIKSDQCDPFSIKWLKVCKPKRFTASGHELIKQGVYQDSLKVFNLDHNDNFMLTSDINDLSLYLSYIKAGKNLVLKEPELVYDDNVVNAIVSGPLSKGGIISNDESYFTINFSCVPLLHSTSLIEMILRFENYDVVNLYFRKECNSVGHLKERFSFFKTLFNIILILVILVGISVCFYYYKRNQIAIKILFDQLTSKIIEKLNKKNKSDNERLNYYVSSRDASYDENDLVDVKIKTDKEPFYKKAELSTINTKYDSI